MIPGMSDQEAIGSVRVPGEGGALTLYKNGDQFTLRVHDTELMSSGVHDSEDALALVDNGGIGTDPRGRCPGA